MYKLIQFKFIQMVFFEWFKIKQQYYLVEYRYFDVLKLKSYYKTKNIRNLSKGKNKVKKKNRYNLYSIFFFM